MAQSLHEGVNVLVGILELKQLISNTSWKSSTDTGFKRLILISYYSFKKCDLSMPQVQLPPLASVWDSPPVSPPAVSCSPFMYFIAPGIPHAVTPKGHCWLTACMYVCVHACVLSNWYITIRGHSPSFYHFQSVSLGHSSFLPSWLSAFFSFSIIHLTAVSSCNRWVRVLAPLFLKWHFHQQTLQQCLY